MCGHSNTRSFETHTKTHNVTHTLHNTQVHNLVSNVKVAFDAKDEVSKEFRKKQYKGLVEPLLQTVRNKHVLTSHTSASQYFFYLSVEKKKHAKGDPGLGLDRSMSMPQPLHMHWPGVDWRLLIKVLRMQLCFNLHYPYQSGHAFFYTNRACRLNHTILFKLKSKVGSNCVHAFFYTS